MAHQVEWNKVIYDEFVRLALLSDIEQKILETRIKGWTITKQSMEYNLSKSSVNSIVKKLKMKYDSVQPYSDVLPVRKTSAKELYMDEN